MCEIQEDVQLCKRFEANEALEYGPGSLNLGGRGRELGVDPGIRNRCPRPSTLPVAPAWVIMDQTALTK